MDIKYDKISRECVLLIKNNIISTLSKIEPSWLSTPAIQLLIGTCAVESNFGYYRKQVKGPARGIFQLEPITACDLLDNYLKVKSRNHIYKFVCQQIPNYTPGNTVVLGEQLIKNDAISVILARAKYRIDKNPIPETLVGIAETWKRVYNTSLGKGTIAGFIKKYEKYAGDFEEINKLINYLLNS